MKWQHGQKSSFSSTKIWLRLCRAEFIRVPIFLVQWNFRDIHKKRNESLKMLVFMLFSDGSRDYKYFFFWRWLRGLHCYDLRPDHLPLGPVLKQKPRYPYKFFYIICCQYQSWCSGVTGNHHIVRPYGLTSAIQFSPYSPKMIRRLAVKRQHFKPGNHSLNICQITFHLWECSAPNTNSPKVIGGVFGTPIEL